MKIDPQLKWKILFVLGWMSVPFVVIALAAALGKLIGFLGIELTLLIVFSLTFGLVAGLMVFGPGSYD